MKINLTTSICFLPNKQNYTSQFPPCYCSILKAVDLKSHVYMVFFFMFVKIAGHI